MVKNFRFSLPVAIIVLVLSACSFPPTQTPQVPVIPDTPFPTPTPNPALQFIVNVDTTIPYNAVNQVITYSYNIKNVGGISFAGPVSVIDSKASTSCPELTLIGDANANLDPNEEIICTGTYSITQIDLDAGSVVTVATADVGGNISIPITTTIPMATNRALTLTISPDPVTYNNIDDKIIYTYTIKNTGSVVIGPAQFTINDDKFLSPITCGSEGTTLAPEATTSCSATYTISQNDLNAGTVTNSATATDGITTSDPATSTITKGSSTNLKITPDPNLVQGSTVSHVVVKGEWLWQIARCYGANPRQVVNANIGRLGNPAMLDAGTIVSVPNIGSDGTPYGPQIGDNQVSSCAPAYRVQSGDTWESIAQRYLASTSLLKQVNPLVTLSSGSEIRVPFNSEGD